MSSYWILSIGLILIIFVTGCMTTQTISPVTTPTPQVIYVTVTVPVTQPVTQSTPLAPVSKSATIAGSGDDVKSFSATGTGLRIIAMTYTGQHNFIVTLKDSQGEYVALLANEIGSYSGRKSQVLSTGTYYLDVQSSGPWTIDISSP
jgi:hypothetical protein